MFAVIRVRGTVNVSPGIKKTLELLRLQKPHHMVVLNEKPEAKGMVEKIKGYVAFGEVDEKTFEALLKKRGRFEGDVRINEETLKSRKLPSVKHIADEVFSGKKKLSEFGIKEVFRLNSPKKGFERVGIKKMFTVGGALGYRGKEINALLEKMM